MIILLIFSRSYALVTNEAIETTCSRLIETVADELERLNSDNNINNDNHDDDYKEKNIDDESDEKLLDAFTDKISTHDSNYDELMEKLVIEEFGRCLVNIIDTAEKRNQNNLI